MRQTQEYRPLSNQKEARRSLKKPGHPLWYHTLCELLNKINGTCIYQLNTGSSDRLYDATFNEIDWGKWPYELLVNDSRLRFIDEMKPEESAPQRFDINFVTLKPIGLGGS